VDARRGNYLIEKQYLSGVGSVLASGEPSLLRVNLRLVDATFLCCTYNRASDLAEMLESALAQDAGDYSWDILVVDNNSRDRTRPVVESFMERAPGRIRYLFEPRQGKSNALNTGVAALSSPIHLIADDDLLFPRDYLRKVCDAFAAHPEIDCLGGRVLPRWQSPPPAWLTEDHYAPLGVTGYGDQPIPTGPERPLCLVVGAFRTAAARQAGGYLYDVAPTGSRAGGIEDALLFSQLYASGRRGLYQPDLHVFHKVETRRVTKRYHRRWHRDHGRNFAVARDPSVDCGRPGPFGVPAYMYRQAAVDAWAALRERLAGRPNRAFLAETHLWFLWGFFSARAFGASPRAPADAKAAPEGAAGPAPRG
jgi:glycosyltransferase involved in cell wall biosynthesis